jgi:hypothetical protein
MKDKKGMFGNVTLERCSLYCGGWWEALTQNSPVHARTKKIDINPVCKRRKEEKAPHVPTVVSLLFGIIFVSFFLNRDLDTALVSGGAAAEAGEEVGNVVLDILLVRTSEGKFR